MDAEETARQLEELRGIAALVTELRRLAELGGDAFLVYLLSLALHEASAQAKALEARTAV